MRTLFTSQNVEARAQIFFLWDNLSGLAKPVKPVWIRLCDTQTTHVLHFYI